MTAAMKTSQALVLLLVGHVVAMDIAELEWISVELVDASISPTARIECYKLSQYVHPILSIVIDDDVETRYVHWEIRTANQSAWTVAPSDAHIAYFSKNATISSRLIGHDKHFKEPLNSPQVLYTSRRQYELPLAQAYSILDMSGECYNVSVSVTFVDLEDFVPTTTYDPLTSYDMIKLGAAHASAMDSSTTTLPVWLCVASLALMTTLVISFFVLLVVHVRSRHGSAGGKLTIRHETSKGGHHHHYEHHQQQATLNRSSSGCGTSPSSVGQTSASAESHYDVPWDHKFRPLPQWLRSELHTSMTEGHGQSVAVRPVACPPHPPPKLLGHLPTQPPPPLPIYETGTTLSNHNIVQSMVT